MPKKGEIYKHFKGNEYEVLAIAKHTETSENLVIYQDLHGDHNIYARPYSMFVEKIDNETFRFEKIEKEQKQIDINDFLDLKNSSEKISYLQSKKDYLTDTFLSLIAQCLDFVETKDTLDERFYDLLNYLKMVQKFEDYNR